MPYYKVTHGADGLELIKAKTKKEAINYLIEDEYIVETLNSDQLVKWIEQGFSVQHATPEKPELETPETSEVETTGGGSGEQRIVQHPGLDTDAAA